VEHIAYHVPVLIGQVDRLMLNLDTMYDNHHW